MTDLLMTIAGKGQRMLIVANAMNIVRYFQRVQYDPALHNDPASFLKTTFADELEHVRDMNLAVIRADFSRVPLHGFVDERLNPCGELDHLKIVWRSFRKVQGVNDTRPCRIEEEEHIWNTTSEKKRFTIEGGPINKIKKWGLFKAQFILNQPPEVVISLAVEVAVLEYNARPRGFYKEPATTAAAAPPVSSSSREFRPPSKRIVHMPDLKKCVDLQKRFFRESIKLKKKPKKKIVKLSKKARKKMMQELARGKAVSESFSI